MLDENVITTLEDILDKTRGAHGHAVAKLREAEAEVDRLRREIGALENSATQTANAIDGIRMTLRDGTGRSAALGSTFRMESDPERHMPRAGHSEQRSNVQELSSRDYRRDNSVAYINQNRSKPTIHNDFEPISNRFGDRTITQSCTMLLREAGRPLHVNELYNLLIAGGMKFKGNNPTISVAVSLSRNSRFRKVDPGTFDLVIREAYQAAS